MAGPKHFVVTLLLSFLLAPLAALATDTDGDGIDDTVDNCTLVANANQRDTDGDGIGNICDPDFNNDGVVNINDFNRLKARLNIVPVVDVDTDLDGNGTVNINDFNRLKSFLGQTPGPAAVSVAVAPRNAGITTAQTQQYSATVKGHANHAVTWRVDGIAGGNGSVGTISASGLYTPPAAAGAHVVTAASQADATKSAIANIGVTDLAGVFTFHNDVARTGQNRQEYALKPASVSGATFGRRFSCAVDGQLYASPLYVANLPISGGNHNVVYVATEHDTVYAFDADAAPCVQYWSRSFIGGAITPVPAADISASDDLVPEVGITSTPVIDPVSQTLYVVARTKDTQSGNYFQHLHALSLATGQEKFGGPVEIQGTVPGTGTGSDGTNLAFDPLIQNQRSALLLLNGVVYAAWGSHGDQGNYHGWIMGYDASTLAQAAVYNATANADEAGIWLGGSGPAAASDGSIYVLTGNGGFDTNGASPPLSAPNNDLGDSIIRFSTTGGLTVTDYFTPANQADLSVNDLDLGSGGALVLPNGLGPAGHPNLLVGGGKEGIVYVLDRQDLGKYIGGGPDQVLQKLILPGGGCEPCGVYGGPVLWQTGPTAATLYVGAVNDTLRAYSLSAGQFPATPDSVSADGYGFPPVTASVSSRGSAEGIVWALDNTHNSAGAFPDPGPAVLRAYDATNLQNRLYSSEANPADAAGVAVKFVVPVIANGKVYVAGEGQLTVYGLLP